MTAADGVSTADLPLPPVVDRSVWNEARAVLLHQEKALMRMKEETSPRGGRRSRPIHGCGCRSSTALRTRTAAPAIRSPWGQKRRVILSRRGRPSGSKTAR